MARKEFDAAILDLDEAIRLDPREEAYYVNRSMANLAKRDYRHVLADTGKRSPLEPNFYLDGLVARSDVRAGEGDFDGAIAAATKAIDLDPNSSKAYVSRSLAWLKKGDFGRCDSDADAAESPIEAVRVYINRSRSYAGDTERAMQSTTCLMRLNSTHVVRMRIGYVELCSARSVSRKKPSPILPALLIWGRNVPSCTRTSHSARQQRLRERDCRLRYDA